MHGIILVELRRYVALRLGAQGWLDAIVGAGLEAASWAENDRYSDSELARIIGSAASKSGVDSNDFLRMFGEFLAPALVTTYRPYVNPRWRTIELIHNTERTIHRVVRLRDRGAMPPALKTELTSSQEVLITYSSPRRLCMLAEGIARGIADMYHELVRIAHPRCMLRGDDHCQIQVTRFRSNGSPGQQGPPRSIGSGSP